MDTMYSPIESSVNNTVRMGKNNKKHIIKGRRIIKKYNDIVYEKNNTSKNYNDIVYEKSYNLM